MTLSMLLLERENEERDKINNNKSFIELKDSGEKLRRNKNENEFLKKSIKLSADIEELKIQMNEELVQNREKLKEVDKVAFKAAENSRAACKEVKKGAKSTWSWLGFKLGFWGGVTGVVAGGHVGSVPGAIAGGAGGSVAGFTIGNDIKNAAYEKIDRVKEEKPELIVHSDD